MKKLLIVYCLFAISYINSCPEDSGPAYCTNNGDCYYYDRPGECKNNTCYEVNSDKIKCKRTY